MRCDVIDRKTLIVVLVYTMGKDKSKDRDARKAGKFVKRKSGIPELEGYYFGHGEERAGARFNKVVEKIADYGPSMDW